jgi:hypothetical protein
MHVQFYTGFTVVRSNISTCRICDLCTEIIQAFPWLNERSSVTSSGNVCPFCNLISEVHKSWDSGPLDYYILYGCSLVWNLLYATLLVPGILRWLLGF